MTPWTVAHQAPLSMGFPRQECWSGFPFPSLGDCLTQGLNHVFCIGRKILYHLSHQGSPTVTLDKFLNTISGLGSEKLQLEENKLNCLLNCKDPKCWFSVQIILFNSFSIYFLLLNNSSSLLVRYLHKAGSRFMCPQTGGLWETLLAWLVRVTAW